MKKAILAGTLSRLTCVHLLAALLATSTWTQARQLTAAEQLAAVGDEPGQALPLATDLSAAIRHKEVERAVRKVAGWQLQRARAGFNLDWTFATLYTGLMAASRTTGDPRYREAVYEMGKSHDWQLGPRFDHADDQAVAQAYLELFMEHPEQAEIANVKSHFDRIMQQHEQSTSDKSNKISWWWCDALFMAPPAWARLYKATGDSHYLDYMSYQWWQTSTLLYDNSEHLYSRDATSIEKREANGKGVFWSRGNGWVMAGLVRVLQYMPGEYPSRPRFLAQFRQMAASVAGLQGGDGLWRPGLLDAEAYRLPEVSGSAFFTYALAWGLNEGILDQTMYRPIVERAWKGLLQHIYADGRLGSTQPVGAAPGAFGSTSSYVFGVGAFLLAGSEVDRMASKPGGKVSSRKVR